jgi:hypothetical protein
MVERNKWILIRDAFKYPDLRNSINDEKMNACVGYLYVDNEKGLSIIINGYFTNSAYKKISDTLLILRHSAFSNFSMEDLSVPQREIIKLPETPNWLSIYEPNALKKLRDDDRLDPFRHQAFPDDVRVLLFQKNKNPEQVWFRVEKKLVDGYQATLLNSPISITSKKGDSLKIKYAKIEDTAYLVAVVD